MFLHVSVVVNGLKYSSQFVRVVRFLFCVMPKNVTPVFAPPGQSACTRGMYNDASMFFEFDRRK